MPRKPKPKPKPERREHGRGGVIWVERRRRWRARLPRQDGTAARESWHRTRDEAEAWLARELIRDTESFDPSRPLGDYLDYWRDLMADRWGDQTRIRYQYEAQAVGAIRSVSLVRLRGDQVMAAQATLLKRKVTRRYAYNVFSLLRRALADAVKWRIIPDNVADAVSLPEPEAHVTQAWTLDEMRAMLAAIVGHRFEACYLLILWGGLRIGEVVGLRWDQIADDGIVAFEQAEHTQVKGRPLGTTKRERHREAQLPAHVVARLRAIRAIGPAAPVGASRKRVNVAYVYVAQRPDGNRWTPNTIRLDWGKLVAVTKHGERPVALLKPHGGRRTLATAHMVAGTALADLSTMLGHSSPMVTAARYLGSSRERRQEATEHLAMLLGTPIETIEGLIEGQE